ncbi:hypothetical protein BDW68DRAFT_192191 [Aspergillus falconensis]
MDASQLFDVENKVVLITGGARGIGRMIAEAFIRNGATVYIASRDTNSCRRAVEELNLLDVGRAHYISADLLKEEDCKMLAEEVAQREKKLDVLVNNSGATWGAPYEDYPSSAWTKVLTLNLHRVFTITQLLTPLLENAASPDCPSRIINIGSINGLTVTSRETFAYSASKAGLHHLSRVLAYHLGCRNITCNTLACGPFQTKMMAATLERSEPKIVAGVPLKRLGTPEDIGGACLFLSSRAGAFVNGATIPVDGGSCIAARI